MGGEDKSLPYGLCACASAAVMFNLALLVWHNLRFRHPKEGRYLKHTFSCTTASYVILGVALILLTLYNDSKSTNLCKFAGFLTLFATQACFWIIALSCVSLYIWIRVTQKSQRRSSLLSANDSFTAHKWSMPIFVLVLIVMCMLLAILSILPLTNVDYFNENLEENIYLCVPLQVPTKTGWGYSALIVVFNWIALIITIAICVICLVRIQTFSSFDTKTHSLQLLKSHREAMVMKWIMLIVYGFNTILWTLVLTIMSITYFSGGDALNKSNTRWGLGYMTSIILLVHPVIVLILELLAKKEWILQYYGDAESTLGLDCPRQLESMQKLALTWQKKDVNQYLIHWKGKSGDNKSGVMKVFHPSAVARYRNEIRTMSKMAGIPAHPNVMTYRWQSPHNPFAATIADLTGDTLSVESGLTCKTYYPGGSLHQFLKSRVHQLNDVGIHKLTQDIASGLEFIHDLCIVHNGLNTQCIYMASVSEKVGLSAVIGDFENSYEVPFDLPGMAKPNLYAISYGNNLKTQKEKSRFAPDIRAFGIIVLEMLVSVSEYNYKKASHTKSVTSSVCSSVDAHSGHSVLPQPSAHAHNKTAVKSQDIQVSIENTPQLHTTASKKKENHSETQKLPPINTAFDPFEDKSEKRSDNLKRTPSIDTYLDPISETPNYENLAHIQRIQQRALPPIPIEKVVEEVQSCASGVTSHTPVLEKKVIHSDTSSAFTPKLSVRSSSAVSNPVTDNFQVHSEVSSSRTRRDSSSSGSRKGVVIDEQPQKKKEISSQKVSSHKPRLAPKPNLLKSIQQVQGVILSESGESDTDTLNLKKSPVFNATSTSSDSECRSPESSLASTKSPITTDKADHEHDDVYNQSVTSVGSFDTIYEDDESQGDSLTRSLDSGLGKSQNFERQPVVKRKSTATVKHEIGDAAWKKKRISSSSFTNESVLSSDSGMGSSHYTASQYGAGSEGSIAGGSSLHAPGSRDPIYEIDCSSGISDPDSYSLLANLLNSNKQKTKIDSGIESAFESCDENPQKQTVSVGPSVHSKRSSQSKSTQGIRRKPELVATEINLDIDEECKMFPDLVVRKKPCKGQHRHLKGMTCCAHNAPTSQQEQMNSAKEPIKSTSTQLNIATKRQLRKTSVSKALGLSIDTTDISKVLVDEGTMTTDSLERKKVTSECIQTDADSYISGLSAATVKSESCQCTSGKHTDCDIQSFHSAGHNLPRSTHTHKHSRQPRLGVTAVNFSRIANNSNRSTPLANSHGPTGSMQSLVNGRGSVTSGCQSVHSLPGGPNSISNSVLSLLQDSNLFGSVDEHNQKRGRNKSGNSTKSGKVLGKQTTHGTPMSHHPVVQHILEMPGQHDTVLDALQKKGFLGYASAQLVPLLKDCWLKEEVVTTEEILSRLQKVLPSASV